MGISYNSFAFLKVQKRMQYLQKYIKGVCLGSCQNLINGPGWTGLLIVISDHGDK